MLIFNEAQSIESAYEDSLSSDLHFYVLLFITEVCNVHDFKIYLSLSLNYHLKLISKKEYVKCHKMN